jgi:hypothetical protein
MIKMRGGKMKSRGMFVALLEGLGAGIGNRRLPPDFVTMVGWKRAWDKRLCAKTNSGIGFERE